MEKKVPERKVTLKDDDIIYVYDKRINKCIREGCEGVVKYGLVLRTSVTEDETLNCFACNKCHMKYTAYPNYVRISKPELLHIYNQEEVTARDLKRAEDAKKQALRERRKNNFTRKTFGHRPVYRGTDENGAQGAAQGRKHYEDGRPYGEKRPYEDRKPYGEKRPYEGRKPYGEKRSYEGRKPYGEKRSFDDRKSYGEKRSFDDRKSYDEKRSYGNRKPYGEHKNYEDRKSYSDKKPYGAKRPYGERNTYSKPKTYGDRKPYGNNNEGRKD